MLPGNYIPALDKVLELLKKDKNNLKQVYRPMPFLCAVRY